jgi:hypothetical protein
LRLHQVNAAADFGVTVFGIDRDWKNPPHDGRPHSMMSPGPKDKIKGWRDRYQPFRSPTLGIIGVLHFHVTRSIVFINVDMVGIALTHDQSIMSDKQHFLTVDRFYGHGTNGTR